MDVATLASGRGLLDWALRDAGMNIRLQCESEPVQTWLLKKNFPEAMHHQDIFTLSKEWMEVFGFDTEKMSFIGGLCCQPFSYIGPRKGSKSNTWMVRQLAKLTRDCRPRFVLVENVAGFISHHEGHDLLSAYMESFGYTTWSLCIPASAFGAPHERQRVFVLYCRDRFVLSNASGVKWDIGRIAPPKILLPNLPGIWNGRCIQQPGIPSVVNGRPSKDEIKLLECYGNAVVYDVGYYVGKHLKAIHDYFYVGEGTELFCPLRFIAKKYHFRN